MISKSAHGFKKSALAGRRKVTAVIQQFSWQQIIWRFGNGRASQVSEAYLFDSTPADSASESGFPEPGRRILAVYNRPQPTFLEPPIISLAHAADELTSASAHPLTLSAMLLIVITLALALVFGGWSWRWRQRLTARRREAELALRTSEDQLRQVSSQLPVALFEYVATPVAGFRSMSPGIARLLPGTAAQMLADPAAFFQGIHADDVPGLIWRAAKPPAGEFEWVGRSRQDDESVHWLQIRATTEITADGQPAIHGVILDVTALKDAQQDLERSRGELRLLATHREAAIELERARLAREVHDELGQVLTAARMQLQLLRGDLASDQDKATSRIEDIEMLIGEAYRSVKSIAADLRPAALNLGLTAAVEWLVGRLLTPAGVTCEIRFAAEADTLAEAQAICLFRIVQESLANIVRHAGAGRVSLSFSHEGNVSRLVIRDDGCGFDPDAVDRSRHFGLLGITERVAALGGTLHLASQAGAGTTLTVEVPS